MLCAALPPASAATGGTLLIDPGTGATDTEANVNFRTPVACDGSTHARVTISGAGFPDDSPILDAIGDPTEPVTIPLGGTWNALAEMLHAPIPLAGTALVVLVCSNVGKRTVDKQFSAQVSFTPTTGPAATYVAEALSTDPTASPNPTLTPPPPTPAPSPALPAQPTSSTDRIPPPTTSPGPPTPSPAPQPSPPPTPDATPAPAEPTTTQITLEDLTPSLISALSAQGSDPGAAGATPLPLAGEDAAGSFTFTVDSSNGGIHLSKPQPGGGYLIATGQINPVTVRDTRTGGPGWSLSMQISDFTSGLSGRYLGWTPFLLGPGAGALPGASIDSGYFGGNGLLDPRELAHAENGHPLGTAVLGAGLDLRIPANTPAGSYQTTLTITALS